MTNDKNSTTVKAVSERTMQCQGSLGVLLSSVKARQQLNNINVDLY